MTKQSSAACGAADAVVRADQIVNSIETIALRARRSSYRRRVSRIDVME
jgi:hypothetical protein